jgi:hypothetical protein
MGVQSVDEQRDRELPIAPWVARVCERSRAALVGACLVLAGVSTFLAPRVSAHATPHVLDIVFRSNGYVLLSNRGLIFGDKDRANWRLMCAEALGINTTEVPSLVGLPDGRLMVSTSRGLSTTADDGCSWQPVAPFGTTSVPALALDPTDPKKIYLAAYTPDPMLSLGGVYISEDGGTNWTKLLEANDHDYVRSIRVAPSDPKHLYATGQTWDQQGKYTYYLTQSLDGGKTWTRKDLPLEMHELDLQLFAVSPTEPRVIAVRAGGSNPQAVPERLLISKDAGETFANPISLLLLSELAFSADGKTAWVVGQDGFFESTDGLTTFDRVGNAESMSYVTERDGDVLACGYYAGIGTGTNGIGMSKLAANGFTSFMQLNDVRAQVACDASTKTAMKCASWWVDWERELMAGQFNSGDGGVLAPAGSSGLAGTGAAGTAGASTLDAGVAGVAGSQPSAAGVGGGAAGSASDPGAAPSSSSGCAVVDLGAARAGNFTLQLSVFGFVAWSRRRSRPRRPRRSDSP